MDLIFHDFDFVFLNKPEGMVVAGMPPIHFLFDGGLRHLRPSVEKQGDDLS